MYFDFVSNSWENDGCWKESISDELVFCACNHLTDFTASVGGFENYALIIAEETSLIDQSNINQLENYQNMYYFIWYSSIAFYL